MLHSASKLGADTCNSPWRTSRDVYLRSLSGVNGSSHAERIVAPSREICWCKRWSKRGNSKKRNRERTAIEMPNVSIILLELVSCAIWPHLQTARGNWKVRLRFGSQPMNAKLHCNVFFSLEGSACCRGASPNCGARRRCGAARRETRSLQLAPLCVMDLREEAPLIVRAIKRTINRVG